MGFDWYQNHNRYDKVRIVCLFRGMYYNIEFVIGIYHS